MLAAERRSEMGMARAIGVRRGHLVQMFMTEAGLRPDRRGAGCAAGVGDLLPHGRVHRRPLQHAHRAHQRVRRRLQLPLQRDARRRPSPMRWACSSRFSSWCWPRAG
ncbi:MAG: ABC transporter permease [Caldilineaceae bacterium]